MLNTKELITIDENLKKEILVVQRKEITHYEIYKKLGNTIKDANNKAILQNIAEDELKHYNFWKELTNKDVKPNQIKIFFYCTLAREFKFCFVLLLINYYSGLLDFHKYFQGLLSIEWDVQGV